MQAEIATGRELSAGDELGRFRLEERLGEGAVGIVFRARDPAEPDSVALKLLKAELSNDQHFLRRFAHEARAAGEVHHRYLVPVLEAGSASGRHYLATRFYEGGSLDDNLHSAGALSLERTLRLTAGLGSALDALHERGLVHRDVKPANVMLDGEGGAALTDFGLAKGAAYTRLTQIGHVVGSIEYLAPELIGGGEATPASDIYAFGCLVHACLAAAPPFTGSTFLAVGFAHMEQEPPLVSDLRPDVPVEVAEVVRHALAKDPARRPPTATAYARMLHLAAGSRGAS